MSAIAREPQKGANVSKPKLKWAQKGEADDFDAAVKFLSLLYPDTKARALVKSLRDLRLHRTCGEGFVARRSSPASAE